MAFERIIVFRDLNVSYEECGIIINMALEFLMLMNCFSRLLCDNFKKWFILNMSSFVITFYAIKKFLMKNYFWHKAWRTYAYDLMWEMSTWDIPLASVRLLKWLGLCFSTIGVFQYFVS